MGIPNVTSDTADHLFVGGLSSARGSVLDRRRGKAAREAVRKRFRTGDPRTGKAPERFGPNSRRATARNNTSPHRPTRTPMARSTGQGTRTRSSRCAMHQAVVDVDVELGL
ncbi:hypothetical protein GCM10020220_045570 [Nonomuraea rubra]